jgi:hypothetical protein
MEGLLGKWVASLKTQATVRQRQRTGLFPFLIPRPHLTIVDVTHNISIRTLVFTTLIGSLRLILVDGTKLLLRLPLYHIPIRERIATLRGLPSWPIPRIKAYTVASEGDIALELFCPEHTHLFDRRSWP